MRRLKTGPPASHLPQPQAISPVAPSPTPFRCPHAVLRCPSVDSGLSDLALLPHLCEVYCRTGRLREAGDVLEKARIIADEAGDLGALKGDLWPAKDLVGASLRRSEEAEAFSKRAINVYQDYGLSWDEARANYEWAIAVKGDGRNALKYIPPACLAVAPDCGMKYLPREVAFGKLVSIVEGTKIVRRERE